MKRHIDNRLALDLAPAKRCLLPGTAPEGLLQALADLASGALDKVVSSPHAGNTQRLPGKFFTCVRWLTLRRGR